VNITPWPVALRNHCRSIDDLRHGHAALAAQFGTPLPAAISPPNYDGTLLLT
jgi:hypothetical protein